MSKKNYICTSESVSEGHPDTVSDRISDSIVDLFLAADPYARVALETLCTTNRIVLAGEVRGPASITHDKMAAAARQAVKDIGYEQEGFHWKNAVVDCHVHSQSADIAVGVDAAGLGYSVAPSIEFTAFGKGSGAKATAHIRGSLTSITVDAEGTKYNTRPKVRLTNSDWNDEIP